MTESYGKGRRRSGLDNRITKPLSKWMCKQNSGLCIGLMLYCKFHGECDSERSLKIGQYLTKLCVEYLGVSFWPTLYITRVWPRSIIHGHLGLV